ncbi:protein O-mannosyl-transferase TMTC4-like isoform X2 [Aricia agestis]|uniref:protein O-mannosyl-transferase TMTC4-like isoform X2 n=1 Tax=Aricia agestis TaxID=91739 RepID=UPI001C2042B1|nr:protein O-mannosyl-transferase TMTC4-like isoform X2 [Aricia agestis]
MFRSKLLCLGLLSSVPYLFSIKGDFVFDDSEAIIKNRDLESDSWLDPFYSDFWGTNIKSNLSHKSYRPLTVTTFRLNYHLNGKVLSAYHFKVVNLILHVLCCVLVWWTLNVIWRRLNYKTRRLDIPYLAALLFSTHPVHVEAVSGIVGRADILAATTFFSAIILYDYGMDKKICNIYLPLSIVLSGMSMLFKENGVTVLGFCVIYDSLLTKYKMPSSKNNTRSSYQKTYFVRRVISVIISLSLLLYGRWMVMGATKPEFKSIDNPAAFSESFFSRVATYNYIYFLNAVLLLWPHWLCYDWSMGCIPLIKDFQDYRLLFVVLLYIYGAIFVINCIDVRRKQLCRNLIFSLLLIAIPFLPAANIFYPVGFVIAERILYIPSAGYCLLIAIGVEKIYNRSRKHKVSTLLLFYYTLFIFGLKTWHRAYDWQNEYKLFLSGLSVCPLNAKVRYNVAKVVDARNYTEWAISEYKTAISLYPEYYQAMNNLANLLKNKKQFSEAESYLRSAIQFKRDFPAAWMNLGIVLANTKQYKESEQAYKIALSFRNKYPDCYYNLGNLYLELNQTHDAMENWFKAIDSSPSHVSAWTNLLALLDNTGVLYHRWKKYELAAQMYKKALQINRNFTSAKKNLESVTKFL